MTHIHAHIRAHTALQAGIIYTYTNVYTHTHSKKSLRVNLLSKCLGGPDMKYKCWKLSGWANIIFLKELPVVPRLEPCCFMHSNSSLASGIKSLRHKSWSSNS